MPGPDGNTGANRPPPAHAANPHYGGGEILIYGKLRRGLDPLHDTEGCAGAEVCGDAPHRPALARHGRPEAAGVGQVELTSRRTG